MQEEEELHRPGRKAKPRRCNKRVTRGRRLGWDVHAGVGWGANAVVWELGSSKYAGCPGDISS